MITLNNDWLDNPRLDLADRHEIEMLCAALNCRLTDVYVAVANVGDALGDVRRFITRTLERRQIVRDDPVCDSLPPLRPTADFGPAIEEDQERNKGL